MAEETKDIVNKRLEEIEREIEELKVKHYSMKNQWEQEKGLILKLREIKVEIDKAKTLAEEEERQGNLARVAEIRYGVLPNLESQVKNISNQLSELQKSGKLLKEVVDDEDIAEIISKWTGIPVSKMLETEKQKLLKMEDRIHERLVNQNDAVRAVSNAIRRSRAGLQDADRPIGTFIFLGSTGIGKTEMAKAVAEFLFDDEKALVRIDMSEYMEKHTVSRLIGAPPGYIGYEEGGQLTEAVRQRPYSVILLDEIEKAHPEVFNVLLQLLDEGRMTDGKGRVVNFKNTIVIMTSNLGAELLQERIHEINEGNREKLMEQIFEEMTDLLKRHLRPEFLNRIDEIVLFKPLLKEEVKQIAKLQLRNLTKMMEKNNISLEITQKALDKLSDIGFDVQYGARPLKRAIQQYLTDPLSIKLLASEFIAGDKILINISDIGNFEFKKI
ncbi:AAA family ATPase [Bacteroidetes/Chlorobi group bacterium ChocPot_Mid]|nr:MAG: AAA family ATPase [Bacteroidetes/Chlorobi group bacterium ChocPot_Mid]